jgi:hypothetical protein
MNNLAIGMLDTSDQSISEYAKVIVDRITKSTISVLENQGYTVYIDKDYDHLLAQTSNYQQVIMLKWGTEIYQCPRFIEKCKQVLTDSGERVISAGHSEVTHFVNQIISTDAQQFYGSMDHMYFRFTVGMSNIFFMFNSDEFDRTQLPNPIGQLVTVAAGLMWLELLITGGYKKGTIVRFTDCSFFALETVKHIVEHWDGTNYPEFIKQYAESRVNFINQPWGVPIVHEDNMDADWAEVSSQYDFVNEWKKIKENVKFEYRWVNYLEQGLDFHSIVDQTENSVLWLSNLFGESISNVFYEEGHKDAAYDRLMKITKEEFPNLSVIFPCSLKY